MIVYNIMIIYEATITNVYDCFVVYCTKFTLRVWFLVPMRWHLRGSVARATDVLADTNFIQQILRLSICRPVGMCM